MKALQQNIHTRAKGKHVVLWPELMEQKSPVVVDPPFAKIAFAVQNGVEFVDPLTVTHLEAQSNYTKIHCLNDRRIFVSRTLKNCRAQFPSTFLRIHQSYLVNPQFIQSYLRQDQELKLDNGLSLPVSRTGKKVMQDFLMKATGCQSE